MRVGAEKSTGLGYGGSGASRNLVARDLGMTSLDLAKAATSALPGFVSGVRASSVATPFDPTSMFLTPIEAANLKKQGVDTQFQRDVYQSQINAAPDPALAALGKTLSGFGGVAASYGLNSSLASRYGVQSPKQYPGGSQWPLM